MTFRVDFTPEAEALRTAADSLLATTPYSYRKVGRRSTLRELIVQFGAMGHAAPEVRQRLTQGLRAIIHLSIQQSIQHCDGRPPTWRTRTHRAQAWRAHGSRAHGRVGRESAHLVQSASHAGG